LSHPAPPYVPARLAGASRRTHLNGGAMELRMNRKNSGAAKWVRAIGRLIAATSTALLLAPRAEAAPVTFGPVSAVDGRSSVSPNPSRRAGMDTAAEGFF